MASTMQFDIPHTLGKAEAKRRIGAGIPKLERHIPGGGTVQAHWTGDDRLAMTVTAMGQKVVVDMMVEEAVVRASVQVPMMLSMMAGAISGFVQTSAQKMLEKPADQSGPPPHA
ncbi:polyhydroxyalkanoic acid system family protein [Sphingomonas chungangi]|nr:polyhydroxyalkanoic acid system family protein [Sphingomonas chungangi]